MRDIGDALGISHVAVSLGLRNHPRIPRERCLEIQAKAAEMGYHPNAMATALARSRSATRKHPVASTIAWINFWDPPAKLREYLEFDAYWKGAYEVAEEYGYRLEEFSGPLTPAFLGKLDGIFRNRGIAAILLPPQPREMRLEPFPWAKYYAIRLGSTVQFPELHLVTAHQSYNASLALRKIHSLGYERIGYMMNPDPREAQSLHLAGYLARQYSLPRGSRLEPLRIDDSTDPRVLGDLKDWLDREKPDVIMTDMVGASAMLRRTGCRIPGKLGLVALSRLDGGSDTGIDQNSREIGRQAVRQLVSLIHTGERGIPVIPRHTLIPGEWVQGTMLPPREIPAPKAAAKPPGSSGTVAGKSGRKPPLVRRKVQ
jgi:DNA-binding LacI/PurR family transcriptional regulator